MEIKFADSDKVLVLDFDHTCYDTDDFLLWEIRKPMLENFKVPADIWERAYENSVRQGYTLETHRKEIEKILGYETFSQEDLNKLEANMNFSKYLYPDFLPFLKTAQAQGYKIMILSFGDYVWQHKKVTAVGLEKIADAIEYTLEDSNKVKFLERYIKDCAQVIFVDNNGIDIDKVHIAMPEVEVYFMNRVPSDAMITEDSFMKVRYAESRKMAQRKTNFNHMRINSLVEIEL